MQRFQVGSQIVDALCIQELANDKRRLQEADGGNVLVHGRIMVVLAVQVIRIAPLDLSYYSLFSLQTQQLREACQAVPSLPLSKG